MPTSRKFYFFDRDNTLKGFKPSSDDGLVINPGRMVPLLQVIDSNQGTPLCIFTRSVDGSGNSITEDSFYKELITYSNFSTNISYPQIGPQRLSSYFASSENFNIKEGSLPDFVHNVLNAPPESVKVGNEEIPFSPDLLQDKPWEFVFNSKSFAGAATVNPGTVWKLKFGDTTFTLNAQAFCKFYWKHQAAGSDQKLWFIFQILDQEKVKVALSPKLQAIGFLSIEAPENYEEIDAKDVIFADDKSFTCAQVREAGFTSIDADTPEGESHKTASKHNTYIDKLLETFSPEQKAQYEIAQVLYPLAEAARSIHEWRKIENFSTEQRLELVLLEEYLKKLNVALRLEAMKRLPEDVNIHTKIHFSTEKAITDCFPRLVNQLKEGQLSFDELRESILNLEQQLIGKPPLSSNTKILIGILIGAFVGVLVGVMVSSLIIGGVSGWIEVPTLLLAGLMKFTEAAITLKAVWIGYAFLGGAAGALVGVEHAEKSNLKYQEEQTKVKPALEVVKKTSKSDAFFQKHDKVNGNTDDSTEVPSPVPTIGGGNQDTN